MAWRIGGVWWDQSPAPALERLSDTEAEIIASIADAMFPGDGVFPGGNEVDVVSFFDHYLSSIAPETARLLRLLLHAIDDMGAVADLALTRFRNRTREERIAILRAWDNSLFFGRRGAFRGVKLVIATAYCEHPAVLRAAGIEFDCGGVA